MFFFAFFVLKSERNTLNFDLEVVISIAVYSAVCVV